VNAQRGIVGRIEADPSGIQPHRRDVQCHRHSFGHTGSVDAGPRFRRRLQLQEHGSAGANQQPIPE